LGYAFYIVNIVVNRNNRTNRTKYTYNNGAEIDTDNCASKGVENLTNM